ncbi:hypothetical protein BGZ96_000513 [Linnemannia gamsii]|uniref:SAP domain-containing protein n=1 Tax=Linnemannia gamsii TaxID=64522 RepID=A0ABQ7KCH7_9FUNG|nr:hypothetical protein BGZ96_000513 [Linnemannia gamsii]
MDPRKLKVNELKEHLQLAGLSVNGKKEELVARLLEHQKAEEEAALAAGPPTGTGESFNWEDPIDDLAPPAADAPTKATPAAATTPAAKAPAAKESATTTSTAATDAAEPASGAETESTTTADGVQFQGTPASDNDALKAEIEKRKSRAARFGTSLTEQDKALERAARFGVPVAASTTASLAKAAGTAVPPAAKGVTATAPGAAKSGVPAKPGSVVSQIPADVLSKRQARFGIVAPAAKESTPAKPAGTAASAAGVAAAGVKPSGIVLDAAEEEKKRKRAAKFGLTSAEDDASKKAKV